MFLINQCKSPGKFYYYFLLILLYSSFLLHTTLKSNFTKKKNVISHDGFIIDKNVYLPNEHKIYKYFYLRPQKIKTLKKPFRT
jgi:hypothetical protein